MSFLALLGSAAQGYGAGAQQRLQNEEESKRLASEIAYQSAETQQAQRDSEIRAAQAGYQFDANGKLQPLPLKQGLYEPIPKSGNPQDIVDATMRNYYKAISANDQAGITMWGDAAKNLAGGYASLERGIYTGGPLSNLTTARVGLVNAQAKAESDLPARAREIAKGHDQTQLTIAGQKMQNSRWLAKYNGNTKLQIATLAGAYRLAGYSEQDAAREAIAYYNGQVAMYDAQNRDIASMNDAILRAEGSEKGALGFPQGWDPSQYFGGGIAQPGQGTIQNFYINGAPAGTPGGAPRFPSKPGGPPAANAPPSGNKPTPAQVLSGAQRLLIQGTSPHDVRAALQDYVKRGVIQPNDLVQIEQMLKIVPSGGSQGANPFSSLTPFLPR